MAVITESDLLYTDYSWTAISGDDPRKTGEPDNTLLNRREGYEVFYFINRFCEINDLNAKEARRIEMLIRQKVPSNLHSRKNIYKWLVDNSDKWNLK
jgi:hypothetical protein